MRRSKLTRWAGVIGAVATLIGAQAIVQAQSAEAVEGLTLVTATSASNANDSKDVYADCPEGAQIVGGGGRIIGAGGKVSIISLEPWQGATLNGWYAKAIERDTVSTNWSLQVYATCTTAPIGVQLVRKSSASTQSSTKQETVWCPSGWRPIAAGGTVNVNLGAITLQQAAIDARGFSVTAIGAEAWGSTLQNWSLNVTAVCVTSPPGYTIVTSSVSATSDSPKTAAVTCPAGTKVHSVSASIGNPTTGDVGPQAVVPAANLRSASVTATEAGGSYGDWGLTAAAVCAT